MNGHRVEIATGTARSERPALWPMERRAGDRRAAPSALHWPERRTGFDRRLPDRRLLALRNNRAAILELLILIGIFSFLDLAASLYEFSLGASEGNPIMRAVLEQGVWNAVAVKAASFLLVSFVVWRWRRYRHVLELAIVAAMLYTALIIYHVVGLAHLLL